MRTTCLIFILSLYASTAYAQDPVEVCSTDPAKYWVCKGDIAWGTGYVLEPHVLTIEQVELWQEKAELLPEVQSERDTFQAQRDDALKDAALWKEDYTGMRGYSEGLAGKLVQAQAQVEERFTDLEVLGIGLGAGGAGVLVGILVGIFAI